MQFITESNSDLQSIGIYESSGVFIWFYVKYYTVDLSVKGAASKSRLHEI